MGPLNLAGLPRNALLLIDSAPVIYYLEDRPKLADRFKPVFEGHAAGEFRFAITTVAVAEILTGPLQAGNEALSKRYRSVLQSWHIVSLDLEIAESAARLRASLRLKLPDAVQAATALAINADALVTHDRDFSRVGTLRVIL